MISILESSKIHIGKVIGHNIVSLRKREQITRVELARHMGISYQQLYKFEKGLNNISAEQLVLIKFYIGVSSYDEFFKGLY